MGDEADTSVFLSPLYFRFPFPRGELETGFGPAAWWRLRWFSQRTSPKEMKTEFVSLAVRHTSQTTSYRAPSVASTHGRTVRLRETARKTVPPTLHVFFFVCCFVVLLVCLFTGLYKSICIALRRPKTSTLGCPCESYLLRESYVAQQGVLMCGPVITTRSQAGL
jgi:hypothetical protein